MSWGRADAIPKVAATQPRMSRGVNVTRVLDKRGGSRGEPGMEQPIPPVRGNKNKDAARGWFPSHMPHPFVRSEDSPSEDQLN